MLALAQQLHTVILFRQVDKVEIGSEGSGNHTRIFVSQSGNILLEPFSCLFTSASARLG